MDGNRRWAKERGLPAMAGHKAGADRLKDILLYAQKIGLKIITVFAFSTENWKRSKTEVDFLMDLFINFVDKNLPELQKMGVKFNHLGSFAKLSKKVQEKIKKATEATKDNNELIFNIALNYGGRDEIVRAVQNIVEQKYKPEEVDEELIGAHLDTAGQDDPDLIIRTSGEQRLSGFLPWQSAYSELYFTDVYWPDFDAKELDKAITEYNNRQRRFGN